MDTTHPAARTRRSPAAPRFLRPQPRSPRRLPWALPDWVSLAVIGVLAAATRLIGLTSATAKGTPVFDEKHYVPQAWDMMRNWVNPLIGGIESNPGYGLVVHPPMGKKLTAVSEALFGYTPLGWRLAAALCGTALVLAIVALARDAAQSWQVGAFAGILATFDGVLTVSSRYGMLDIFQVLFIVLAAWAILRDHLQVRDRFHQAWRDGLLSAPAHTTAASLGPRLGYRWWRFAAGLLLGLSLAVKWSGLYYIAFFGLLSVALDLMLRRRYGVRRPILGTAARDIGPALASLVLVPIAVYLWSWRSWFASETSIYRHSRSDGSIAADSLLHKLPESIAGFIHYHTSVLSFHASLTSSSGHHHAWDSKPWSWLVAGRPILYFSSKDIDCAAGAGACRRMIFLFGTPAIWWLTIPVILWAAWRLLVHRDVRLAVPVVGFVASFLPWLAAFDRQMYFFYAAALVPFTIVMLAVALGDMVGRGRPIQVGWLRRLAGPAMTWRTLMVISYLALVIAMFLYFSPILYGYTITNEHYNSIMWLPSWK
ncbi:dolichyl-phosphate-mannose--protein mannosyltransferase [Corynebacterium uberis]|uniref:dolichyl-phosphate-mannose--protein mannosyltransferase n=1 Tax=Corynebacterium uberis TaxID=2883169 RepID=UPI001D0B82AD|nr:glycosyltransferase family 39 protein [Corynebacterium uberis]UDL76913.1 glycosyltransferase family 39 protein [Corynebacterium uberis]